MSVFLRDRETQVKYLHWRDLLVLWSHLLTSLHPWLTEILMTPEKKVMLSETFPLHVAWHISEVNVPKSLGWKNTQPHAYISWREVIQEHMNLLSRHKYEVQIRNNPRIKNTATSSYWVKKSILLLVNRDWAFFGLIWCQYWARYSREHRIRQNSCLRGSKSYQTNQTLTLSSSLEWEHWVYTGNLRSLLFMKIHISVQQNYSII